MTKLILIENSCFLFLSVVLIFYGLFLSLRAWQVKLDYFMFKRTACPKTKEKLKVRLRRFLCHNDLMSFLEIESHCTKMMTGGGATAVFGVLLLIFFISLRFIYR